MERVIIKRRGFLLVETLAALIAASIFLSAALLLFSACSRLLARSREALSAELVASSAIAAISSGEGADNVVSTETLYAGGMTLRRVTLQSPDGGTIDVVMPARLFR